MWVGALEHDELWLETPEVGVMRIFYPARFALEDTELDSGTGISPDVSFNQPSPNSFRSIRLDDNQALTISGGPGEAVVLNLRNFALYDDATLTLQGTATTTFIINVRHGFSLSGNAKVTLAGGLQWDAAFFNVTGSGSVVSLSGNASLGGILTATNRKVRLSGEADILGEVFAKKIRLAGNAEIIQPPITSP